MKYEVGGSRRRGFGLGLMTGSAMEGGNLIQGLQNNVRFRINSARDMLTGQSELGLGNRRMEIMNKNQEFLSNLMGGSSSSSSRKVSTDNGSGSLSTSSSNNTSRRARSVSSTTPSMSEVDVGTKQRAEERGFRQ